MAGAPLAYEERGRGPAIVLVHGHPLDRRMWRPQLEALSGAFRVVAPDLPGYGKSPARGRVISMRGLADAVVELMDAIGVDRATVVGLSLGGLVAMELGLDHPDRTAGLVPTATTAATTSCSTAEITAQLVASLPDPEVLVIPGVGHLPNLEAPARFDGALRAFAAAHR